MGGYSIEIAAERAGVDSDELSRLTELGIWAPTTDTATPTCDGYRS